MQRLIALILLSLPQVKCGGAKLAYVAGDGESSNFFEISTCECKDDGTVVLQVILTFRGKWQISRCFLSLNFDFWREDALRVFRFASLRRK